LEGDLKDIPIPDEDDFQDYLHLMRSWRITSRMYLYLMRSWRTTSRIYLYLLRSWRTTSRIYLYLKVHKRENFLGSDIEICTFS
jgi:hypothetical protein